MDLKNDQEVFGILKEKEAKNVSENLKEFSKLLQEDPKYLFGAGGCFSKIDEDNDSEPEIFLEEAVLTVVDAGQYKFKIIIFDSNR